MAGVMDAEEHIRALTGASGTNETRMKTGFEIQ